MTSEYETPTQDLLPLMEEWRQLRLQVLEQQMQVDLLRTQWMTAQEQLNTLNTRLQHINNVIELCIDKDMSPEQAHLTIPHMHNAPQ